jgi:hypothetical protein
LLQNGVRSGSDLGGAECSAEIAPAAAVVPVTTHFHVSASNDCSLAKSTMSLVFQKITAEQWLLHCRYQKYPLKPAATKTDL